MMDAADREPIYVTTLGAGARDVLAVHCTMAQSGAWKGVARGLDDVARLTVFDVPGHGRSADWDGQGDFLQSVAEIGLGLLDRPMDLVGHSFGAVVALQIALSAPEQVRTLTLIEPVLMCAAIETEQLAVHDAEAMPLREFMEAGDPESAARHFNAMWSGDGAPEWSELPAPVRAGMIRAIPLVLACDTALYMDVLGITAPGRLEGLRCPVQLIRGGETHVVIGAINDALAARIPGAENKVIPDAGHMVPITHAAQTAKEIRAFFDRHPV